MADIGVQSAKMPQTFPQLSRNLQMREKTSSLEGVSEGREKAHYPVEEYHLSH